MNTKKKKRPADINQLAASIVADATDQEEPAQELPPEEPADDGKDPNAVALGRKGGLKGGKARAAKLTPEQRKAIAKKAADARWEKK